MVETIGYKVGHRNATYTCKSYEIVRNFVSF